MARLKYNGLSSSLGASLTNSATSMTLSAALTHSGGTSVPTITGSDYIPVEILDSSGRLSEIVWITAYTSGATTATIARGKENTTGVAHSSGDKLVHGPVISDVLINALTPAGLHATYGDHFEGSSLDAKWTRVGYVAGDEQYQKGDRTWLQVDAARAAGNYYYQSAPAGDFTLVWAGMLLVSGGAMFGPLILDSSGNGVCATPYSAPDAMLVASVSAGSYGGTFQQGGSIIWSGIGSGRRCWFRLNKTGTAYKASASLNGQLWTPWTPTLTFATTPTRIGFGGIYSSMIGFGVDFFDVQ